MDTTNKITVEIWSDIMCPFCFIAKRQFENALTKFHNRNAVEVVWHSYQLDSNVKYQGDKDFYSYVAELKGQSREWSVNAHAHIVTLAKSLGLEYNFDKAKITNSFGAHRVIQLAKKYGLANIVEERLFRAYFTEGELLSDHQTLIRLGYEAGLSKTELSEMFAKGLYIHEVYMDRIRARQLGISGVPYFLFNGKHAVSGAQGTDIFLEVLQQLDRLNTRQDESNYCKPSGECN